MENGEPKTLCMPTIKHYQLLLRSTINIYFHLCNVLNILHSVYFGEKNTFRNQRPSLGFIVIKDLTSKSKILLRRSTNIFYSCGEFFNTTILFNFIFENIINTDKNPLSIEILDFYITMSFIYSFTILPVHIMYMSSC